MSLEAGLYLIPTQLSEGSLAKVLPAYNIEVVRQVRFFVVESLRAARRFLKKCDRDIDIDALTFSELNEHTDLRDTAALEAMLSPIGQGEPVAVLSDAGCPAVADPGADLVAIAQRRGYKVFPLVGPSSILMSLMASGFNGQRFAFEGYLPVDAQTRQSRIKEMTRRIMREQQTQIFIEAPYRNNQLIADLAQTLPPTMRLCVASDITGERQSIVTRTIGEWRQASYDYHKVPTIFLLYQ
ncbi:MAG: SAM-dependent methyltransferase [Muribaculaceae bacterium]|nr:SAM-dependent methyltransferase [Muribaculaceae bacterium]